MKPITPILHHSSTPKRCGVKQGLLSPLAGGIRQNQVLMAWILYFKLVFIGEASLLINLG
jgi:hypothetical protein